MNYNNSIVPTDTLAVPEPIHPSDSADSLRSMLERLIATKPFTQVMATLARVCHAKASQIRSTSVDEHLALAWDFNAQLVKRASKAAHPTDPTIALRAIKLGIDEEELQRRIDTLPEPLRVIAMDYAYGALPPAGRSSAMRGILRDIIERLRVTPIGGEDALEQARRAA